MPGRDHPGQGLSAGTSPTVAGVHTVPCALGVGAGTVHVEGVDAGEGAVARTTVTGLQAGPPVVASERR